MDPIIPLIQKRNIKGHLKITEDQIKRSEVGAHHVSHSQSYLTDVTNFIAG